jgi:hypothetical protein
MALALYFAPSPAMTAQQYNETVALLKKAGAGHPPGRLYHACFGTPDSVQVFDVWTSMEAFEKFGQTLMPIMQSIGLPQAQPTMMTLHNTITPPAARSRKAAKPAKKAKAVKKATKAKAKKGARKARGRKR